MTDHKRPPVGTTEGLAAAGVFVELITALKANNARLEKKNGVLMVMVGLLIVTLMFAMPFKKVVPFFYEVDSATGRVAASGKVADELKITDKNIGFFLRLWAARLVVINAATLKQGLPSAYKWTRGAAATELDNWVDKVDQTATRIGKIPGLSRELIGTPVVSFNEDRSVAFIDLVWAEKINGVETDRRRKLLTVEFGTVAENASLGAKQVSTSADDLDNPLGLVITHFTMNDQESK